MHSHPEPLTGSSLDAIASVRSSCTCVTSAGTDLITAELAKLRARHTLLQDLRHAQRLDRDQQLVRYLAPTPPLSEVRAHLARVYAEVQQDAA